MDHHHSLKTFLSKTSLPKKIPTHMLLALERDFTVDEPHQAISSLPPGQKSRTGWLMAKFYKVLMKNLTITLLDSFNSVSDATRFPPAFLQAHITVIPKEGKDPQLCQSYRPISLINTDAKLFARLLVQRQNPLL